MRSLTLMASVGTLHVLDYEGADASTHEALPMLLVHGMVGHSHFWDAAVAVGTSLRRTFAMDLRGHGDSTAPADGDYTPAACASDVYAVLNALNLDRVALVGHSYGALVALAAASRQPDRLPRLVLVDPPGDFTQLPTEIRDEQLVPFLKALATDDWRTAVLQAFEQAASGGTPETQATVLKRVAMTPRDRLIGMYDGMFAFNAVDALDRYLAAPDTRAFTIVAPANTLPFSLHVLRPTLPTMVLPNVGHWLILDSPASFAAALDTCLSAP